MFGLNSLTNALLSIRTSFLKEEPRAYCDLETTRDDYNFVGKNGELAVMLRIKGLESIIGDEEFSKSVPGVSNLLHELFKDGNHVVDASFSKDASFTRRAIERCSEPSIKTMERLNLSLRDIVQEDDDIQEKYTVFEEQSFMIWTLPSAISNGELKEVLNEKKSFLSKLSISWADAQNELKKVEPLFNYHNAAINSALSRLQSLGFKVERMKTHEACRNIRMQMLPYFTNFDWRPILAGDPVSAKIDGLTPPESDISELLYPNLGWQLCPFKVELEGGYVKVGNLYYTCINIEQFPGNSAIEPFPLLFEKVKSYIPWRIRTLMSGTGVSSSDVAKAQLAAFMAFTPKNKGIIESVNNLNSYKLGGGVSVRTRITLTTWARDISTLKSNQEELINAVQSWGAPTIVEDKGDPRDSFFSSVTGFSRQSVATATPVPTEKLAAILPLYRPASPWDIGSMKFRTVDGKPFYYQPNSHLQTVNITLVVGKSRNGKGVLNNAINIGRCLAPGLIRLPRISIIEMEPSSLGFIRLLKNRLPQNQRHEALYHRMNINDGINPFDTLLGLKSPTTSDKEFLIDFIIILISPDANSTTPYDEMRSLLKTAIDQTYDKFSSYKTAKKYMPGVYTEIDTYLIQNGFKDKKYAGMNPSWWDARDFLFEKNEFIMAEQAQSLAVPIMDDLLGTANASTALNNEYEAVLHKGSEQYVPLMIRKLSDVIRHYPCFSKPTQVFFSNARVISLDLADVASTPHSTAIFATFGAWITTRFFYVKKDKLPRNIEPLYKSYFENLVTNIKRDQKELTIEEYQRYHAVSGVATMVERFMAEGGKDNVSTTVITQLLSSFTPRMRQMATSQFLLVAGISNEELIEMKEQLALTTSEMLAITLGLVHPPKEDGSGSSFLFRYTTKEDGGWKSQVLNNTRSPSLLWHLSTTTNDTELRELVFSKLGEGEGLKALLQRFPQGSANSHIEEVKLNLGKDNSKQKIDVIEKVAKDVIELYYKAA